jgi:hypothetical protein
MKLGVVAAYCLAALSKPAQCAILYMFSFLCNAEQNLSKFLLISKVQNFHIKPKVKKITTVKILPEKVKIKVQLIRIMFHIPECILLWGSGLSS